VPEESRALLGLALVNRQLLEGCAKVLPAKASQKATLDHDASIIESRNREAYPHYKGGRGYQPVFVLWDELDVVVADEFRDGNVPAGAFNLPLVKRAFEALPSTVKERYFRADSACYDQAVLSYLRHENIGFAVSADMSQALPPFLKRARPKRLRFEIIRLAGIVVHHARCVVVKLAGAASRIAAIIEARFQLAGVALALSG
jgi:hypothetical protein